MLFALTMLTTSSIRRPLVRYGPTLKGLPYFKTPEETKEYLRQHPWIGKPMYSFMNAEEQDDSDNLLYAPYWAHPGWLAKHPYFKNAEEQDDSDNLLYAPYWAHHGWLAKHPYFKNAEEQDDSDNFNPLVTQILIELAKQKVQRLFRQEAESNYQPLLIPGIPSFIAEKRAREFLKKLQREKPAYFKK
ncbi:hypothetical protein TVAG_099840 [Trichomonas vaginalis G3]|uniref:Uncharacterized protein n=1 Tax=Trichomonas vaginalis (strain ATCC PRA-98 / G3) TaxID=412133 RepID=A2EK51_TRIV3|nr:hypothetical protein TVAGG3_0838210 [Trichomonas vaginalis G3]EAY06944.1 hypothetical protein TVAG_099840 [Trichomonas vaginalis G3]KAI5499095.1 hypothetical protein TVAGG3_0838210 [Trichomonas vaginalis G3]|eukprot:XP_001319167.1 hypothetical protein [Trichomonas vaginalis G3]